MTTPLAGRNALVTGGTRGLGRAITLALARAGADVVTCYRQDEEAAQEVARELKAIGGDHHVVRADVSRGEEVERLVEQCRTRLGPLHVLVNNAGLISHVPFVELGLAEWRRVLDGNLTAAYLVTRAALALLPDGASIVNMGSKVALVGMAMRAHYTAAKAGMIGLTRSLAKELGPRGIRVNLVTPGVFETHETLTLTAAEEAALQSRYQRYRQLTALGRLGRPEEVGDVVVFLASDQSRYVTGDTVAVDGGI
jgi:3-oxoacyl-[acyl-carrier protein] reductase